MPETRARCCPILAARSIAGAAIRPHNLTGQAKWLAPAGEAGEGLAARLPELGEFRRSPDLASVATKSTDRDLPMPRTRQLVLP